uniref:Gag polyprotein n=1 Tax=Talaromyces marneffei PM1 TaxID=1077442 RepID=A0A093VU41_TALMA
MDGEHQQHGYYQYPSVPGHPHHVVQQQVSPARSPESFRRSTAQSVRRSRAQPQAQPQSRGGTSRRRLHRSSGTAASHHDIPSSTDALQQNVAPQFQQRPLSPESMRHVQSQQVGYSAQQQQQYDTDFLYGFDQSGTAQMSYGMSLPENLGGLSSGARFRVPQQYFPSPDDDESVSQYLSTQEQLAAAYHPQQRSPLGRQIDTSTMTSFNPTGSLGSMRQQATQQNMTNLEEAYNQYRRALITVFGSTQRGNLNEASRLLLDLSAWLIDNARDLGLFRDDPDTLTKHRQLWHEFNICWLSLCQKQKDLTEALLRNNGHHRRQSLQLPPTMLSADSMEKMGQEIIRFCDLVEPHGLVDYQMGIWEEEILDILGQCLDLMDS